MPSKVRNEIIIHSQTLNGMENFYQYQTTI